MVEGARVQATPSARILSPPRVAHNRGVTVSPPPPPVSSLCGPSGHPSHPHSPGLVFRLGVVVPGGLDTLLSHISKHRERGLHNEVDEACNADNTRTRLTWGVRRGLGRHASAPSCTEQSPGAQELPVGATFVMMYVTPENSTPALHAPAEWLALTGMGTGSCLTWPSQHP